MKTTTSNVTATILSCSKVSQKLLGAMSRHPGLTLLQYSTMIRIDFLVCVEACKELRFAKLAAPTVDGLGLRALIA